MKGKTIAIIVGLLVMAAAGWYFLKPKEELGQGGGDAPQGEALEAAARAFSYTVEGEGETAVPAWQAQAEEKVQISKTDFERRVIAQIRTIISSPSWMDTVQQEMSQEWQTVGGMDLPQAIYQKAREWVSSLYYYS